MKNLFSLLFCIILIIPSYAQKIDLAKLKGMSIRNIGPAGMSGRVTAIDVDLTNHRIFTGTASGGVWLSENAGISWRPIFEDQPTQSIGSIKVNQQNPLEIWVGTGEGNPRNSHNAGVGIFRSIDGGKTWNCMGLQSTKLIHRILIDPNNPNIVYAGVLGSAWGTSTEKGVFKTIDGGKTWKKILYVNDSTGVGEMVMDPQNPAKLIVNMWQFIRSPWNMKSGGRGSGIFITYDGGDHWKKLTDKEGIPEGNLGRCGLAIAPSNPKIVYALIEAKENALFVSTNGGENFSKVKEDKGFNGRPFYFYEIYVDPKNENTIYSLHTYLNKSIDGGKTYKSIADYGNAVHPDHHALWIDPTNPNYLLDGNDGGMNVSYNAGESWQFILNLPVGQFYHVNVDHNFPYHVYGGMQDNGSWVGPGFSLAAGGIRNSDWQEVYFGDGFDVAPIANNNRFGYAMSQGGDLGKYDLLTGKVEAIRPVHPEGKKLRFNWNAGFSLDPHNPNGLYYGSQYLHYSSTQGADWKIISPDLTTNDSLRQPKESGGLTPDVTGAENNTTILSIAPSPINKDIVWVGTDDGNIQLTEDGGKTWTNMVENMSKVPRGSWIPQIEVSEKDPAQAFVVINNYRRNDYKAYLMYTDDFGKNWTNLLENAGLPSFVNCIVQDKVDPNLLFLGADDGLYISFDMGKNWNHWTNQFPQVQIQDMKVQDEFSDLVIASFGRSFWVMDDINPLRKIAASKGKILEREFAILSSPIAYDADYKSFTGSRFFAQADFNAANKSLSAQFLVKANTLNKKVDSSISKKAIVKIYNSENKLIREYKAEMSDTGLSRIYWGLESNGLKLPSKSDPKEDEDKPQGPKQAAGSYKVVISWKGIVDSINFVVKTDPRDPISSEILNQRNMSLKELRTAADSTANLYAQIRNVKKSIDLIEKLSRLYPDSTQKKITHLNEDQRKFIHDFDVDLYGPEGTKGIERDADDIMSSVYSSFNYVNTSSSSVGTNPKNQIQLAIKKLNAMNEKINAFLSKSYVDYQKKIEEFKLSPFKIKE